MYVCVSVRAHMCASPCVPVSGCAASVRTRCMSVRVCTLDACVHVPLALYMCVYTCVHMYVCLYACGHICLHMCVFE